MITESKFKTFGCGSAIASSSVATDWIKGKTIDEVLTIKNKDIAGFLKLPPVKLHCSMLAEDAIHAAVKDYKVGGGGEACKPNNDYRPTAPTDPPTPKRQAKNSAEASA